MESSRIYVTEKSFKINWFDKNTACIACLVIVDDMKNLHASFRVRLIQYLFIFLAWISDPKLLLTPFYDHISKFSFNPSPWCNDTFPILRKIFTENQRDISYKMLRHTICFQAWYYRLSRPHIYTNLILLKTQRIHLVIDFFLVRFQHFIYKMYHISPHVI